MKRDVQSILRDCGVLEHRGLSDFVKELDVKDEDEPITLKKFT